MSVPELYSPMTQTAHSDEPDEAHPHRRLHRPLPLWVRIGVLIVGWIVVLIGIAGLVLPGIQGIATIVAGAAILSVASELCYKWTKKALHRWPWIWTRVERFRIKIHDKLHDMVHRSR